MLLLFSILFYAWGEPSLIWVLVMSTLTDFLCGLIMARGWKKTGLVISLMVNLGSLAYFKYGQFAMDNLRHLASLFGFDGNRLADLSQVVMPIGISFYTFQTLSYTIDVYRGQVAPTRNFTAFAAYVTLFPQLIAGPILRYADLANQLRERVSTWPGISQGIERFVIGLSKKVLLANFFAIAADDIFSRDPGSLSTPAAWGGALAYTLQLYFDFSGYSDMAIGLGRIMGFTFPENFNHPYVSTSIRDFWRRWHISLSTWFRDYVYIPLGGSRMGKARTMLNLIIVFFVTGLWHGASWNFIVWGMLHGFFIILERTIWGKIIAAAWRPFKHMYTLLIVIVAWVFFRAEHLSHAVAYLKVMFSWQIGDPILSSYLSYFHLNAFNICCALTGILAATPLASYVGQGNETRWRRTLKSLLILMSFILSIMFLNAGNHNPFIYFRF